MGMEISARHLQQADERTQAGRGAPVQGQEPDAAGREKFNRAMQERDGSGQQGEDIVRQEGQGSTAPSPASLMESLFGQRMTGMNTGAAPVAESSPAAHMADMVDRLVDRILVSEPGRGNPEVLLSLGDGALAGAELRLGRGADGLLSVQLLCPDANTFQTAVGAQDSLRNALERTGEQVRVEVSQGGAEGGNEGDSQRRSATYMEDSEHV